MELINKFAELSKALSEKFSLKKSEVSLYLLALLHDASNLARYSEFMSPESHGNFLIEAAAPYSWGLSVGHCKS